MEPDNTADRPCPVNSFNEWDPLEEVIVGRLEFATFKSSDIIDKFVSTSDKWDEFAKQVAGKKGNFYSEHLIRTAQKELDEFIHILKSEGVIVRQPEMADYSLPYATPDWQVQTGFNAANPRDVFLVIGNEIIETPMADRNRYYEAWAYRGLLKEYFKAGARWTSAPKPQLTDAQYNLDHKFPAYAVSEFEPTFDAADFARCGRDIIGQKSHVTNQLGIEWLQRHLGDGYHIHLIENLSPYAIHIDSTFMPLAPGRALINPEFVDPKKLPPILRTWDVLVAPEPVPYNSLSVMSNWISINTLMLDEKRIIVEKRQEPLIIALKEWGFEPIPCSFENYYPFLGGFHCATLDIRRRGTLQSYF